MFLLVNQKQYTSTPMLLYVCISNGYYRIYVVVIISCTVIQQISVIYFVRTILPRTGSTRVLVRCGRITRGRLLASSLP